VIKTDILTANALRMTVSGKLGENDFHDIAPQIDSIIGRFGQVRLLIDATGFNGWANVAAFENHVRFIKDHQAKVDRIAVIAGHEWQHWLVGAVRILLHPDVRAYDRTQDDEALRWIES